MVIDDLLLPFERGWWKDLRSPQVSVLNWLRHASGQTFVSHSQSDIKNKQTRNVVRFREEILGNSQYLYI